MKITFWKLGTIGKRLIIAIGFIVSMSVYFTYNLYAYIPYSIGNDTITMAGCSSPVLDVYLEAFVVAFLFSAAVIIFLLLAFNIIIIACELLNYKPPFYYLMTKGDLLKSDLDRAREMLDECKEFNKKK